ncbi:MAG TPA: helix-turn-helix domain-containing protein [Candidatus Acidoferrum sp.]|nr:helix-turn-helix domain-containing protein [Candidatus Acidoferrum sp.]
MSFAQQERAWKEDLPKDEKVVLLCLARHAHDDGTESYPSIPTIARETGWSETAVREALRKLEAKGLVALTSSRKGGRKATAHYSLCFDAETQRAALPSETQRAALPSKPNARRAANSTRGVGLTQRGARQNPTRGVAESVLESVSGTGKGTGHHPARPFSEKAQGTDVDEENLKAARAAGLTFA